MYINNEITTHQSISPIPSCLEVVHVSKVSPVCDFGVHNLGAQRMIGPSDLAYVACQWNSMDTMGLPCSRDLPGSECKTGKSTNSLSKYFTSPPLSARCLKDFESLNHSWLITFWIHTLHGGLWDIWLERWRHSALLDRQPINAGEERVSLHLECNKASAARG